MSGIVKGAANILGIGSSKDHQTTASFDPNQGYMGVDMGAQGSSKVVQNPDGSWSKVVSQGANDEQRNNLVGGILNDINPSAIGAQDAYYNAQMRLLEPQFDRAQRDLDEHLINRGIQVGGTQYSQAMGDLLNSQNTIRQNASDQALQAGQNFTASQINNTNALTGGRDVNTLLNLIEGNSAYENQVGNKSAQNAEKEAYRNQRSNNILGFLGF